MRSDNYHLDGPSLCASLFAASYQVPGEHPYIAISRTSPVLSHQDEIMRAFEQIRKDGTYEKLMTGYQDRAKR